jgi:penicillin-insensitive murein endopeptidase
VPLLRTHHVAAFLLVLAPVAAQAAPASKKPPPAAASSQGPRHETSKHDAAKHEPAKAAAKAAPGALKNASHGATAHLAPAAGPQRTAPGKSIGSPTEGHLVGGAHLVDSPYLRSYPVYAGHDVRWGVESLVGLIDRAAKSVRTKFPDAVLSVGHLSKAGGGELDRHASHESGRDADVGFYVKNVAGKPLLSDHMVAFVGDGTAPHWPGAHFDDARNWSLIAAMVGDGRAHITHIFVATPIRQRLLAYAEKIGAPPALRSRASEVLAQPHGALPHDDHFHVRIACPPGMEKCVEVPLAHHGRGRHGAVASNGHPAHPSHGAHASASGAASHAAPAHAAPAPAPAHGAAAHPAAPPSKPARSEAESARSEAPIPSLAPSIPGLDSAVIPSPLTGVKSTWGTSKDPAPTAPSTKSDAISDPDGVLDAD